MSRPWPAVGSPQYHAANRHMWAAVLLGRERDSAAMWALFAGLTRDELVTLALRLACCLVDSPPSSAALRAALLESAAA